MVSFVCLYRTVRIRSAYRYPSGLGLCDETRESASISSSKRSQVPRPTSHTPIVHDLESLHILRTDVCIPPILILLPAILFPVRHGRISRQSGWCRGQSRGGYEKEVLFDHPFDQVGWDVIISPKYRDKQDQILELVVSVEMGMMRHLHRHIYDLVLRVRGKLLFLAVRSRA